jgi:hypothetical protein
MSKKTHELKTWPLYFQEVFMGHKTFEIRINDRDFQVGDYVILKEWDGVRKVFTGRELARTITYILNGGQFGIQDEYVIMSIS